MAAAVDEVSGGKLILGLGAKTRVAEAHAKNGRPDLDTLSPGRTNLRRRR